MPQNWKTYKLGEVSDRVTVGFVGSMAQEYIDQGIPMLRSQNIKPFSLDFNNLKYISESFHKKIGKSSLKAGDVAIIRTGAPGTACVIPDGIGEINCSDLVIVTPNTKLINPHFLCFYFNSIASHYVSSQLVGAVQQHFNVGSAKTMEIKLPPIAEQNLIVTILKSIIDKIELNLQMNKILEEMAMTLYKRWFVDFEFPSSGGVVEDRGGQFPSSGGVDFIEDERRGGSFSSPAVPADRGGRNTTNYMSLPYNPKLKERAKALRKAGNLAEVLFWQQVHKKQFMGLDFDRQKIIGNYIVDFYCANVNVVVEIDGSSHDNKQDYDAARDAYLEGLGLTVIHITDEAVKKDLAQTMEDLKAHPAFNSPPPEGSAQQGVVNSPPPEGWISSKMKDGVVLSRLQQESPQGEVNSPPLEESPQGEVVNNHPAFQAPLQGRGRGSAEVKGYKSSGGKFIDSELGPIPEGWEVKRLEQFVELTMGQSPKSEFYNDNQEGLPFHQGVSDYGIRFPKDVTYSTSGNREAIEGDILFSVRAPVGRLNIAKNRIILGRGLASMRMKDHNNFLFYALKNRFSNEDTIGSGTVFNSVNKTDLLNLEFIIPPIFQLNRFKEIVEPLDKTYYNNSIENQTLTSLRDTLLPKLISGEVRVKDVESQVAEVL